MLTHHLQSLQMEGVKMNQYRNYNQRIAGKEWADTESPSVSVFFLTNTEPGVVK